MINTEHLLKVALAWTSIVYVVCFGGVALYPPIRTLFVRYALHIEFNMSAMNIITPLTFVTGLFLWNLVAALAVLLFATLFNRIRS
jgi:hypothetical protein